MRLRDIHTLSGLFLGLVEEDPRAGRFLLRGSVERVRLRAQELQRKNYARREFADLLAKIGAARGGGRLEESIRKLCQPHTLVVLSSWPEQFGGGTLSWFLKCLTAVRLVRELENAGIQAVPLCWVSPREAGTAEGLTILDSEGHPGVVMPPTQPHGSHPDEPMSEAFHRRMEAYAGGVPYPEALEAIRKAYAADENPSGALTNFLRTVFEEQGLIFFDGEDPELRDFWRARHRGPEIGASERESLVAAQEALLRGEGYLVGTVADPEHETTWLRISRHFRFEQSIPVAAHVVDEAEVNSFALSAPFFDAAEMARPLVWPRSSATLMDVRSRKILDRYSLRLPDLADGVASIVERAGASKTSAETLGRWDALSRRVDDALNVSITEAKDDPDMSRIVHDARSRITFQVEKIRERFAAASQARLATMARQVERVCNVLRPGGRPQELQIAGLYFLMRYSPAILETIVSQLDVVSTSHQLISVE